MPAAAVIPAPVAYIKIVAFEKLVVGIRVSKTCPSTFGATAPSRARLARVRFGRPFALPALFAGACAVGPRSSARNSAPASAVFPPCLRPRNGGLLSARRVRARSRRSPPHVAGPTRQRRHGSSPFGRCGRSASTSRSFRPARFLRGCSSPSVRGGRYVHCEKIRVLRASPAGLHTKSME